MSKPEERMLEELDQPRSSGPTKSVSVVVAVVGLAAVGLLAWYLNSSLNRIETAVGDIRDIVQNREAALAKEIVRLQEALKREREISNRGDLDNPPGPVGGPGTGTEPTTEPTTKGTEPEPSPKPKPKPTSPKEEPTEEPTGQAMEPSPTQVPGPEPIVCVDDPTDGVICVPNPIASLLGGMALGGVGLLILRRNGRKS